MSTTCLLHSCSHWWKLNIKQSWKKRKKYCNVHTKSVNRKRRLWNDFKYFNTVLTPECHRISSVKRSNIWDSCRHRLLFLFTTMAQASHDKECAIPQRREGYCRYLKNIVGKCRPHSLYIYLLYRWCAPCLSSGFTHYRNTCIHKYIAWASLPGNSPLDCPSAPQ